MNLKPITCYNNSKIFIQSALYGRSDNVTCLGGQEVPMCNASIDLSWRVLPVCQGKSSCVINGSYDELESPCDGNNTNYLNISYSCKTRKLEKFVGLKKFEIDNIELNGGYLIEKDKEMINNDNVCICVALLRT